jgi:hypothetical protein
MLDMTVTVGDALMYAFVFVSLVVALMAE